ncbi:MAG: heme exporter protein CcmD [Chromatiaceae bacterium]|jgi:heme exporter protein CcmD
MLEKLDMGKHALYVWGSFGMTAFCMVVEPLFLRNRTKQVRKRLARMVRLNQEVNS